MSVLTAQILERTVTDDKLSVSARIFEDGVSVGVVTVDATGGLPAVRLALRREAQTLQAMTVGMVIDL